MTLEPAFSLYEVENGWIVEAAGDRSMGMSREVFIEKDLEEAYKRMAACVARATIRIEQMRANAAQQRNVATSDTQMISAVSISSAMTPQIWSEGLADKLAGLIGNSGISGAAAGGLVGGDGIPGVSYLPSSTRDDSPDPGGMTDVEISVSLKNP